MGLFQGEGAPSLAYGTAPDSTLAERPSRNGLCSRHCWLWTNGSASFFSPEFVRSVIRMNSRDNAMSEDGLRRQPHRSSGAAMSNILAIHEQDSSPSDATCNLVHQRGPNGAIRHNTPGQNLQWSVDTRRATPSTDSFHLNCGPPSLQTPHF